MARAVTGVAAIPAHRAPSGSPATNLTTTNPVVADGKSLPTINLVVADRESLTTTSQVVADGRSLPTTNPVELNGRGQTTKRNPVVASGTGLTLVGKLPTLILDGGPIPQPRGPHCEPANPIAARLAAAAAGSSPNWPPRHSLEQCSANPALS